jgi:hypothetical protein
LPRNFCLKNLIDIDYNNGFLVLNANVIKLATQVLKTLSLQIPGNDNIKGLLETRHHTGATIYSNLITA